MAEKRASLLVDGLCCQVSMASSCRWTKDSDQGHFVEEEDGDDEGSEYSVPSPVPTMFFSILGLVKLLFAMKVVSLHVGHIWHRQVGQTRGSRPTRGPPLMYTRPPQLSSVRVKLCQQQISVGWHRFSSGTVFSCYFFSLLRFFSAMKTTKHE